MAETEKSTPISISMQFLNDRNHFVGDIERGVKIFNQATVEFTEQEPNYYVAKVPHKKEYKTVSLTFSDDGKDLLHHFCHCSWRARGKVKPICRHVVAAILSIQGGIIEDENYGQTEPIALAGAEPKHIMVIATCADRESAKTIAKLLVETRLAACAQMLPIESVYRWKGEVCEANEIMLFVKTTVALYGAVETAIKENQTYEVPEIIKLPILGGFPAYLTWIDDCIENKKHG